jgi:putative ABC transport system ATP-binding protein
MKPLDFTGVNRFGSANPRMRDRPTPSGEIATELRERVTLARHLARPPGVDGPSGSGKTTLLNILGTLDRPTSGSIRIEGCDLGGAGESELAGIRLRRIGFVFQDFNLIPVLSAAENVEFPLLFRREFDSRRRKARTAEILDRVQLTAKKDNRPDQLSRGECQRLALARALAGDPSIVLADEPTANLDQDTGATVIGLMRQLNRERDITFLYATHEPRLLALADSVLHLHDGRIEDRP